MNVRLISLTSYVVLALVVTPDKWNAVLLAPVEPVVLRHADGKAENGFLRRKVSPLKRSIAAIDTLPQGNTT